MFNLKTNIMRKNFLLFLLVLFFAITAKSQSLDYSRAPNSFIFDPFQTTYDGLYIPVKKAYEMWNTNEYIGGEPIVGGTPSASLYWEDVSGLIKSVNLEGSGENAKIKVLVDKAKGKGNAVIAFKVNGEIKWSWHVWVTDNPTNGSTYRKGFEKNKNGQLIPDNQWQWMDRNLGATNASFLGSDWNKSAGLMYQWGRKDPFPPLQYKDGTGYEIYGEIGEKHYGDFEKLDITNTTNPLGWVFRPFNSAGNHNEVAQNLKYAVKNPLRMITFLGSAGSVNKETWFSDTRFKVDATGSGAELNRVNFDLWGDTRKGLASRVSTSNAALKLDSESYELKSAFDPCPNGWRVPSHYGSSNGASGGMNLSSPWGRGGGGNDDIWNDYSSTFYLNPNVNEGKASMNFTISGHNSTTTNNMLPNVKVYPSLGLDFNDQANRNLGYMPITGAYTFVGPYETSDYVNETPQLRYIVSLTRGTLHTSTLSSYSGNGEMGLWYISDNYKTAQEGKFRFAVGQAVGIKGAEACRCIKDPNLEFIGDFVTEYVAASNPVNYELLRQWSKDANSYIVMTNQVQNQKIKTRKAYAMHKLELSGESFEFPSNLSVHTVWTTNANLINSLTLDNTTIENSEINVKLNANQYGNAVVALHAGNSNTDPILWSWHIWAPETNPEENTITYQTESIVNHPNSQIINHTKHAVVPPLKTIFMNRNLGALDALPSGNPTEQVYKKSIGLHYQWGRKDPIPTFLDQSNIIVKGASNTSSQYNTSFVTNISNFNSIFSDPALRQNEKDSRVIKYTVENPLNYIYNPDKKDWISNKQGMKTDRWGHATEKSPYDPCPDGWRIPDTSLVFFNSKFHNGNGSTNLIANDGRKGYSPWYLGDVLDPNNSQGRYGINQFHGTNNDNAATNSQYYKGSYIGSNYGWSFNDPVYNIGTYPNTGIRGESTSSVSNDFPKTLVWTAALDDDMVGNAFGLSIRWSKMQTGGQASPTLGASCRCAKDETRIKEEKYCPSSTAWNGIAWSNGIPDSNKKAIINGAFVLSSNLEACELEVGASGSLEIPSGFTFTVNGIVINNASAEDFVVESGGNLIQTPEYTDVNVGEITVYKESNEMVRNDQTLWSSPVENQSLRSFSPETLFNRFWGYSENISQYQALFTSNNQDAMFSKGAGYAVRVRNTLPTGQTTTHLGKFVGVPFNGDVNVNVTTTGEGYNIVGNPYASNIKVDDVYGFFGLNENVEVIYFWTHQYPVGDPNYGNNYNSFTTLGNTDGSGTELKTISVGQGFFVKVSEGSNQIKFNNKMRVSEDAVFYKNNHSEKHRIWLSLSSNEVEFCNILIGYMPEATNHYDKQIDGKAFKGDFTSIYTLIEDGKYSIQGRALPFQTSDIVKLGFRATEAGQFNISLSNFDGLFSEGEVVIYLKDNELNLIHNLIESPYSFEAKTGEFNERFEIVFEKKSTMSTEDLTGSSVQIYTNNQNIIVESKDEKILSVELYDLSGREIHSNHSVNAKTYNFKANSKGVLVVKVQTKDSEVTVKKVIIK